MTLALLSILEFGVLCAGVFIWPQCLLAWLLIVNDQWFPAGLALATTMIPRVRFVERIVIREVGAHRQMTRADAAACLGCGPDPDPATVSGAYRRLMARVHPDSGGTHYLAASVNEARAILLGRRS